MLKSWRFLGIYPALFFSGAAALVYQATWGRLLHRVFGVSDLAIATVLASFFLGLGLGSVLGGRWGQRVKRPALLYAAFELTIGVYAVASVWLVPRVHGIYTALGEDTSFEVLTLVRLILALVILLPPTILMGATLPVLVAILSTSREGWTSPATWLYATNTFGAVVGAGATGLWLVPELGVRTTIWIAACLSVAAAAMVAALWRKVTVEPKAWDSAQKASNSESDTKDSTDSEGWKSFTWLAVLLAGITGLAALSGEVLWTRVLRYMLQGTTQSFAAMLVNYLLGITLGSLLADAIVRRGVSVLRTFGVVQVGLALVTALSMVTSPQLVRFLGLLSGTGEISAHDPWDILLVSAILLLPVAMLSGMSIPLAWRISGATSLHASRWAGRVLASNTIGGLLGSLAAGFLLIPNLGIEASILTVIFINLLAAAIALRSAAPRKLVPRVLAVAGPLLLGAVIIRLEPSLNIQFLLSAQENGTRAILEGPGEQWREQVVFLEEGRNTTVHVTAHPGSLRVFNDGQPESGFEPVEPGFGVSLALLGGLPTLYSAQRGEAMVIGLGAGHTVTTLLAGPWRRVDVIELEPSVVRAARMMHKVRETPFPLDDPRARLIIDDARARLALSAEGSYDAIVSQPSHPWLSGSSALYTREFFEDARRALRPGGVMTIWVNLFRIRLVHVQSVVRTLQAVYPHVHGLIGSGADLILVASEREFSLSDEIDRRMRDGDLPRIFGPLALTSRLDLVKFLEIDCEGARVFGAGGELIVDDRPMLEFDLARVSAKSWVAVGEIDRALADSPWLGRETLEGIELGDRVGLLQSRIDNKLVRPGALRRAELSIPLAGLAHQEVRFLEGVISEGRGDHARALARFDEIANPVAANRADSLRFLDHRYDELIDVASRRKVAPSNPYFLLAGALMTGRPDRVAQAISLVPASAELEKLPIYRVTRAVGQGGCPAVVELDDLASLVSGDVVLASEGLRCALAEGRRDLARSMGDAWLRARLLQSSRESSLADNCFRGGNYRASVTHFEYAVDADPSNAPAAAGLARALGKLDRRSEAEAVLRRAAVHTKGLPSSALIRSVATELSIDLGSQVEEHPADDSYTTVSPPMAPDTGE